MVGRCTRGVSPTASEALYFGDSGDQVCRPCTRASWAETVRDSTGDGSEGAATVPGSRSMGVPSGTTTLRYLGRLPLQEEHAVRMGALRAPHSTQRHRVTDVGKVRGVRPRSYSHCGL